MRNAAEEKKARSSMTSTFGSVMNPDADRGIKQSLESIIKRRERDPTRGLYTYDEADLQEIVSFFLDPI